MNSAECSSVSLAEIAEATLGRCAETETKKSLINLASLSGEPYIDSQEDSEQTRGNFHR